MSSLDAMISMAGESSMLNSLDYRLMPSSTAVVARRQHCRAYPTSASTLTPVQNRTFRIRLGGDSYVDPQSIRLQYQITENSGVANTALTPTTGAFGMWSQLYLRSGGTELQNTPQYGRFHAQYGWNQLSFSEQWGEASITDLGGSAVAPGAFVAGAQYLQPRWGTIPNGGAVTVMHKVHCALFDDHHFLPTKYCPLELEMSLNPTTTDWLAQGAGTSQGFSVSNVQLIFDVVELDAAVEESMYKGLLSNNVLTIPFLYTTQTVYTIPAGSQSFQLAAVRAFSKLSHVWLTFRNTGPRSSEFLCPRANIAQGRVPELTDVAPTVRLSLGPMNIPDPSPAATIGEHFYQLQQALGNIPNIDRDTYTQRAFTMVFDLKKIIQDNSTAASTRSGDLLRIDLQGLTGNHVTEVYLTMFAFSVCAISESGCQLLN